MINSARRTAAWVLSVFRDRSRTTMMQLYKSLVRSKLEYCCPVWSPTKIEDIKAIECLQRTFTSKISGLQHLSYWERLERLNMMSLQRRRERYLIIHMWKVRMAQVPNDLNIKFHYNDRLGLRAIVPKAPQSHVGSVYQNSFAVKGPRLWKVGTCYPKTVHLLIILNPSRQLLTDSYCNSETLPLSLVMRTRSLTHCCYIDYSYCL